MPNSWICLRWLFTLHRGTAPWNHHLGIFCIFSNHLNKSKYKMECQPKFCFEPCSIRKSTNRRIDISSATFWSQPPKSTRHLMEFDPPKSRETAELQLILLEEIRLISSSMISTPPPPPPPPPLPETKTAPENWELENYFPLAFAQFSGANC